MTHCLSRLSRKALTHGAAPCSYATPPQPPRPAHPAALRPARRVFGYSAEQDAAIAAARAIELAGFALADAEEALAHARKRYVEDRAAIGLANKGIHRGFKRDAEVRALHGLPQPSTAARAALRRAELHLVAKQAALAALTAPTAH